MTKVSDRIFSGDSVGERLIKMNNILSVVKAYNYAEPFSIFKLLSDIVIFVYSLKNKMIWHFLHLQTFWSSYAGVILP